MQLPCPACNFPINLGEPPASIATCPACGATVKQAASAERSAIDQAFAVAGQRPLDVPTQAKAELDSYQARKVIG